MFFMSPDVLITEEVIARQPPEAQAIIRILLARLAAMEAEIAALKKTPRNSSLPPSTEHPHAKPTPQKEKSGKKQGGQPGHPKYERSLIPTEQCQKVVRVKPRASRRCGGSLAGNDPEPLWHQAWEIPEMKPLVTEYRHHRLNCPCCGISTCGELPAGVPHSQAGP